MAASALSKGNKGGGRNANSIARVKNVKAMQAQLAFLNAMVAELHDKLEAQANLPGKYKGRLMQVGATKRPIKGRTQGEGVYGAGISVANGIDQGSQGVAGGATAGTLGGDEQPASLDAQGYFAHTDSTPSTDSTSADVSRETSTSSDTAPASVSSALDGYEKRLEAMGLRVPVPVVPDEIWKFLEGAEAIEDGHLRLQKYQAAMRAFGRYYTQIGEVDRGFQVVLMLTNQMKDMYMARSKSAGGYLVRESELAALEAEISGMSDEELAAEEEKGETNKDS